MQLLQFQSAKKRGGIFRITILRITIAGAERLPPQRDHVKRHFTVQQSWPASKQSGSTHVVSHKADAVDMDPHCFEATAGYSTGTSSLTCARKQYTCVCICRYEAQCWNSGNYNFKVQCRYKQDWYKIAINNWISYEAQCWNSGNCNFKVQCRYKQDWYKIATNNWKSCLWSKAQYKLQLEGAYLTAE